MVDIEDVIKNWKPALQTATVVSFENCFDLLQFSHSKYVGKTYFGDREKNPMYSYSERSENFSDPLGEKLIFNYVLEIMLNIKKAKKKYLA